MIDRLNQNLVDSIHKKDDAVALSVPEIIDFGDGLWGTFSGLGVGKVYDDIFIDRYYEYVENAGVELSSIGINELKRHNLVLTNEDGSAERARHSIYKSLVFDTAIDGSAAAYHLCEGNWYLIDSDYVVRLRNYLDPLCEPTVLPDFNQLKHKDEGEYNAAAANSAGRVCLDKKNISPDGQKQVEPCDVYEVVNGRAVLHCVKISTLSAQLSHLFNQGTNSVNLLRSEPAALEKLKALVIVGLSDAQAEEMTSPLDDDKLKVVFDIITHKDPGKKSDNLPLFSRISLMRCMKELKRMGIQASYSFVVDSSPKSDGRKRRRRRKRAPGEDVD